MFDESLPLAVYVHMPWCVRKCPYCDFNSHALRGDLPESAYVDAVLRDLDQELPAVWGRRPVSVFIGGGTPSLFSPGSIDRLLSGLRARLALAPAAEITLEANPGTVDASRFRAYRAAGVNRLSIGVQSFADERLAAIGRIHGGDESRRAVDAAHDAGFADINLDIMYGLPGQTVADALEDVQVALALEPSHISHYQLTLEPNTAFHREPPELPDERSIHDMETVCRERLDAAGFRRYEVSAYAPQGRDCVHNRNYWEFGDYLGLGAGAHGKITDGSCSRVVRRSKRRHPRAYLETPDFLEHERALSQEDLVLEFMMNALRLVEGFSPQLFRVRSGLGLTGHVASVLSDAEARGLLERSPTRIRPTPLGLRFLNELVALFMADGGRTMRTG